MQDAPLALYVGPDATAIESRWTQAERPFSLLTAPVDADVRSLAEDHDIDCLVTDGSDALSRVAPVRDALPDLPVVAFGDGNLDASTALDHDVTHLLDGDGDPIETLESVAPTVERYWHARRERTMLDSLLENIPLSVYFKDRQGRHVRVSDVITSMIGAPYIENPEGKRFHSAADVVGATDFDLYPRSLAEGAVADDQTVMESEEPITDRLERFAEVISHDLRNPLEVARARVEFAREDGDPEHFDVAERSLDRMDELIDDVLTLARQGETVSDPEPIALEAVARDAWDVVESGDASLVVDTSATVEADPGRLRQILENLFRNAVEHSSTSPRSSATHEDAVEHGVDGDDLTVTVGDLREERGFYVADDGTGIPEEERESVFDAGFSTSDDGTGLGLNIVRTIADAHGWHVTVSESPAGGASFHFEDVTLLD